MSRAFLAALACGAALTWPLAGQAGNVFVTGHDPDFHADDGPGAEHLLEVAMDHVTCDTTLSTDEKFLVITARPADLGGVPAGHRDPITAGFAHLGVVEGIHYDVANAALIPTVDFNQYTALAVVSGFGGLLTRAELDALNARRDDVIAFLEAGGGVFASSECDSSTGIACGANLLDPAPAPLYDFLPFPLVSVASTAPFVVTPEGLAMGLTDADVNDATHNSFTDDAGMIVIDYDARGLPTTLAGRWTAAIVVPSLDSAQVVDPSGCGAGLLVSWTEAGWIDPASPGTYAVYRSEGPAASCDDAVSRPPLVAGLTGTSWFDRTTEPGVDYVYVVEAEDVQPVHGCDPPGPSGGSVARVCTDPVSMDLVDDQEPDGVHATLRLSHDGHDVTLSWPAARPLLPGEEFRLLKSSEALGEAFGVVPVADPLARSHVENDPSAPRQYFDLRVADECELLSLDEYPPGR